MKLPPEFVDAIAYRTEQIQAVGKVLVSNLSEALKRYLGTSEDRYKHSRNPYYAWDAYQLARRHGMEIPPWVLAYFDEAAERLLDDSVAEKNAMKVAAAIGMGPKPQADFKKFMDEDWVDCGVYVRMAIEEGDKQTYAIERVAKLKGLSESTVHRHWKRYEKAILKG